MNIDHVATAAAAKTGLTIEVATDAAVEYIAQIEKMEGSTLDQDALSADDSEFLIGAIVAGYKAGDL